MSIVFRARRFRCPDGSWGSRRSEMASGLTPLISNLMFSNSGRVAKVRVDRSVRVGAYALCSRQLGMGENKGLNER